jgi:hypothetical protein
VLDPDHGWSRGAADEDSHARVATRRGGPGL